jgi:putative thioredoxin
MEQMIGQSQVPPDTIKDSDIQHFAEDVLAASREVPVIVDFWAPWCGPCKQLTPVLEKVVRAAGGAVKLVKVNVDENQAIAQQLRIQSIPAVYAFKNGQPVDGFAGALPESQVKAFVQRLTGDTGPSEVERAVEAAQQAQEAGDFERAESIFGQVLRAEPDNGPALGGLAQCYVARGDLEQAREILASVPPKLANDPEVAAAKAAVALAEQTEGLGDTADLQAAVDADPDDHQARFDLSLALVARGEREAAVEHLLEIVRRNRAWNEEAARKQLVTLFEAFGPGDPLTVASRRRLSSLLFS